MQISINSFLPKGIGKQVRPISDCFLPVCYSVNQYFIWEQKNIVFEILEHLP